MPNNLVLSPRTPSTPILDPRTGSMRWEWIKFFQDTAQAINNALTILGYFNGTIATQAKIQGRTGTLVTALEHLNGFGQLDSLTNVIADVNTDHIADGTGSPLAGGAIAHQALVNSGPSAGNILQFTGTVWNPTPPTTVPIATSSSLGIVEPDNSTITIDGSGIISAIGGSGTGGIIYVNNEQVAGSGTAFTLANVPITGAQELYNGAARIYPGALPLDYTISGASITMNYSVAAGELWADYPYAEPLPNIISNEQVGGSGTAFTLANVPTAGSVRLYVGSARIYPGTLPLDYTISGANITMNYSIGAGELWADYEY